VHHDIPVIPIYYEVYFDGVNQRVTGYQVNMLRIPVNAETWDTR
jgi:ABC-type transport system substrate-binding protein